VLKVLQAPLHYSVDGCHGTSGTDHLIHMPPNTAALKLIERVEQDEGLLRRTILGLMTVKVEPVHKKGGAALAVEWGNRFIKHVTADLL